MKIALIGYGKMGKTIEKLATAKGHEIVFKSDENCIEFQTFSGVFHFIVLF
jgi:4-hydroxy-tetrahydrodipicolinate reductase